VAQCNDLIDVSNELGELGETLGNELEAELDEKLASLAGSDGPPDFVAIADDLGAAADTIDGKAGEFLGEASAKLAGVALQDETLLEIQTAYLGLLDTMGTNVGNMSQALRDMGEVFRQIEPDSLNDISQLEQLEQDMGQAETNVNEAAAGLDGLEVEEDELVAQINAYCGVEE
jgi:hypothetical protein